MLTAKGPRFLSYADVELAIQILRRKKGGLLW
jgi:hypothetical protein